MATIEELFGLKNSDIESMSDEDLKVYMADIIKLEPKPLPNPLGTSTKSTENVEMDGEETLDDNPIKALMRKKKKPNPLKGVKLTEKDLLEKLGREIDEI